VKWKKCVLVAECSNVATNNAQFSIESPLHTQLY
jgi:hypothetical protein